MKKKGGGGPREASTGGAPALAGHNTACGGVFSGVVSKIFAVKKKMIVVAALQRAGAIFPPEAPLRRGGVSLEAAGPSRRPMFVPHAGARRASMLLAYRQKELTSAL